MKLHKNRPIRTLRRPLYFANELGATVLREFTDAQLEYYSYILRKKYALDFSNGLTTQVPGHIKVSIENVNSVTGENTSPTSTSGEYVSLAQTGQSWTEGKGGIEDKALVPTRVEERTNNINPPPGADLFPSPAPNLLYRTASSMYNFMRNDKFGNQSALDAITVSDFSNYGYITIAETTRDNTSSLVISNTTVENAGILKLENSTFVDGLSGDHKLILNEGSINNIGYNLRQVGGAVDSSNTVTTSGNESEEYVVDAFFKDVEEKIRSYDVGAVRIDNFQLGGPTVALANEPGYNVNNYTWQNLGLVYTDTRLDVVNLDNPYDNIYEYNMYVNVEINNPPPVPTHNGREIKALAAIYGTDSTDGRRLVEQSNAIGDDFIVNFLYKIFLRRYPVYDFSLTQPNAESLNTEMGFVTDTYFDRDDATTVLSDSGPGTPTYTKTSTANTSSSSLLSDITYFVFRGLRGDTPTYYSF